MHASRAQLPSPDAPAGLYRTTPVRLFAQPCRVISTTDGTASPWPASLAAGVVAPGRRPKAGVTPAASHPRDPRP